MPATLDQARATLRLLLVDDHQILRQVLELALDAEPDLLVVGASPDAESALADVGTLRPDVVLMDLDLPGMDGIEATRRMTLHHPRVRVVVLTGACTRGLVTAALEAGARGYLLKEEPLDQLLANIRAVGEGRRPLAAAARALLEVERP